MQSTSAELAAIEVRDSRDTKRPLTCEAVMCNDKPVFDGVALAMDAIAHTFGRSCEVVLHSFADLSHSIVKIENGHVSGRSVGSPATDKVLDIVHRAGQLDSDVFSYYTALADGRTIKSTTAMIRNESGRLIGVLCINLDISGPLADLVGQLVPSAHANADRVVEHFPGNVGELVREMVAAATAEVSTDTGISSTRRVERVVWDLYRRGAFEVKGAVDLVAKELGVSRYTVYNYIREARAIGCEHQQ